jgi:hypothetical protein
VAGHLTSHLPALSPGLTTYVADVEAGIPTWCRGRDSLLTELAVGLTDTAEHHLALGVSRPDAERRAVNDSGPAAVVAQAITEFLVTRHAGRTARTLLLTGPTIGLLWLAALTPGQTPDHLLTRYPPLIPVLVTAVASAVLTLLVLRRPTRPTRLNPPHLLAVACVAAAVTDTFMLATATATAGAHATQLPGGTLGPVAVLAATASIIRLALAPRAARQALRRTPDLSDG